MTATNHIGIRRLNHPHLITRHSLHGVERFVHHATTALQRGQDRIPLLKADIFE